MAEAQPGGLPTQSRRVSAPGRIAVGRAASERSREQRFRHQLDDAEDPLQLRDRLRKVPRMVQTLNVWWETAQRSMSADASAAAAADPYQLNEEGHARCMRCIYLALMEDEEDDTACEAAIADDWASDTRGEPLLSRERFFDALLELADAWTAEASEQAYNEFLWRLFENVTTLRLDVPGTSVDSEEEEEPSFDGAPVWRAIEDICGCEGILEGRVRRHSGTVEPTPRQKRAMEQARRRMGAATMQAAARGRHDRNTTGKLLLERRVASSTISSVVRGRQARQTATERKEAIVTIQKHQRQHASTQEVLSRQQAILRMQVCWRGLIGRRRVFKLQRQLLRDMQKGLRRSRPAGRPTGGGMGTAIISRALATPKTDERVASRTLPPRKDSLPQVQVSSACRNNKTNASSSAPATRGSPSGSTEQIWAAAMMNRGFGAGLLKESDLLSKAELRESIPVQPIPIQVYDPSYIMQPSASAPSLTIGVRRHAAVTYLEKHHTKSFLDRLNEAEQQQESEATPERPHRLAPLARAPSEDLPDDLPDYGTTRAPQTSPNTSNSNGGSVHRLRRRVSFAGELPSSEAPPSVVMDDSVAALQPDEPPPFWWQAEARDVADDMDAILRRNGINHEELPSSSISGLHHEPMPADVPPFGVRRRLTSPRYKPRPDPANALPEPPSLRPPPRLDSPSEADQQAFVSPLGFGHYSSHSSPGSSMRPAKVSMRKGAGMTLLHRSVSQSGLPPIQHSAMLQHHIARLYAPALRW